MLHRVLDEWKKDEGPLTLAELSRRLDIEQSALRGMIAFWVRKGRIKTGSIGTDIDCDTAANCSPGRTCSGPKGCPFIVRLPQTYSLVFEADERQAA